MALRVGACKSGNDLSRSNVRAGRVLMLVENNSYPKDPRVRKEAQTLRRAGYDVVVISPADNRQKYHDIIDGVNVYRFPAAPPANGILGYAFEYLYSMAAMFCLTLWVFLRHDFDVIHVANPPDTLVFIAAVFKCLGKRFVFDHHDLAPEMYHARFPGAGKQWVYQALLRCEALSCRLADHVLATNESYRRLEMCRDGVDENAVTIVRNGPDLHGPPVNEVDDELRNRAGTIVAYAGIIGIQDGVDYLLRAIRELVFNLHKTDVLCLIVGAGDALAQLQIYAGELGIADYILFTGWIDDPRTYAHYLSASHICVDPSPSNPYNDRCTTIKLMEYMAAAKPIVAFDLGEHRFTAGAAAIYARPNDERELARAMAELIDDAQRRETMGRIGRRRIEQELAWNYSARHLLEAYGKLLPRRSPSDVPSLAGPKTSY